MPIDTHDTGYALAEYGIFQGVVLIGMLVVKLRPSFAKLDRRPSASRLAAVLLFATSPLWGDSVTVIGAVGSDIVASYVSSFFPDLVGSEFVVNSDGSVSPIRSSAGLQMRWSYTDYVSEPTLPAGATLQSVTFRYSDPMASITTFRGTNIDAKVDFLFVGAGIGDTPDTCYDKTQDVDVYAPSVGGHSVTFTPCAGTGAFQVNFSGLSNFLLVSYDIPTVPGFYFLGALANQDIQYSVEYDYATAAAVPEPSPFLLTASAGILLIAVRMWRSRGQSPKAEKLVKNRLRGQKSPSRAWFPPRA